MGEDEVAIRRRFFKIMMPDFEERLKLPPAFCERLKQEKSERAILESHKGTWEINVSRDDDLIFFEDGWPQFVDEHGLSVGDFLVFEHTQHLLFNVLVFDPTACEKRFAVELAEAVNPAYHRENAKRTAHEKSAVPLHSESPFFTMEMTPYIATKHAKVTIPIDFVRSNNLGQKKRVTLRDCGRRRRRWAVKLVDGKRRKFYVRMSSGWHDFYASNQLQVGDVCLFELNPTSPTSTTILFDVQIFRASSCNTMNR